MTLLEMLNSNDKSSFLKPNKELPSKPIGECATCPAWQFSSIAESKRHVSVLYRYYKKTLRSNEKKKQYVCKVKSCCRKKGDQEVEDMDSANKGNIREVMGDIQDASSDIEEIEHNESGDEVTENAVTLGDEDMAKAWQIVKMILDDIRDEECDLVILNSRKFLLEGKFLPAKVSSRESFFPRKFLPAKVSSRESFFPRKFLLRESFFPRKFLPAKVSSRESFFPRKFLPAKVSSRESFFPRKFLPAKVSSRESFFPRKFLPAKVSSRESFFPRKFITLRWSKF